MSKTAVGKFYMAIDHNLKQKGSRPDDIYWFVEKIILSDEPDGNSVKYGVSYQIHHLRRELKEHDHLIKSLESKLTVTDTELDIVKRRLDAAEEELVQAKCATENAKHKVTFFERKIKAAVASKLKTIEQLYEDHTHYKDELIEQYSHLSEQEKFLKPYIPTTAEACAVDHGQRVFHTIENRKQLSSIHIMYCYTHVYTCSSLILLLAIVV